MSAPFPVGPLARASYIIQSFYDYTGDFLPTFKFRELPEKGDIGGGDIDLTAALQPINQNPNYMPSFQPIDVGIPQHLEADAAPGTIPLFTIPPQGFVAQNVQVTVGKTFGTTRPYFYAEGLSATADPKFMTLTETEAQSSAQYWGPTAGCANCNGGSKTLIGGSAEFLAEPKDHSAVPDPAHYAPVLTIPQDIHTFAPPVNALGSLAAGANKFQAGGTDSSGKPISGLPHLRLRFEGSDARQQATAAASPFNMQLTPWDGTANGGGIPVWQGEWLNPQGKLPNATSGDGGVLTGPIWQGQYIPDSVYKQVGGSPIPLLWPLVILSKLVDDPTHTLDPASLTAQGDADHPVVIMQGITLLGTAAMSADTDTDSLFGTGFAISVLGPANDLIDPAGNPKPIYQDHITALLRPAVICFNTLFDANNSDKRGNLVTPYLVSESSDFQLGSTPTPIANTPVVPPDLIDNGDPYRQQVGNLIKPPPGWTPPAGWAAGKPCTDPNACGPAIRGCLPKGRYAINVVYPDGQAWTVPNEAGACTGSPATGEGITDWNGYTCTVQKRNVIQSQGPRAVVEIVGPSDPNNCKDANSPVPATPAICLPTTGK